MAHRIAHRIRTVLGFAKSLEDRETRADVRRQLRWIRGNDDAANMLTENLEYRYAAEREAQEEGGPFGGPLMDFLDWLLSNKDAIIEFIKAIIALFMPTGLPDDVPDDAPASVPAPA